LAVIAALFGVGLLLPATPQAATAAEPGVLAADESDASRAERLNREAVAAMRNDLVRAESLSRQALQAARLAASVEGEALASVNLARIARYRGNYALAVELYTEAQRLSDSIGDRTGLARLAADRAILYSVTGLFDDALTEAERARQLYAELGDQGAESSVLITLGNIHGDRGDGDLARRSYNEALAIKRAAGIEKGVGIVMNNLAELELEAGNTEPALRHLDEAIALHREIGDDASLSMALSNQALALAGLGRFEEARRSALQAAAVGERVGTVRPRLSAALAMVAVLKQEAARFPARAGELLDLAARRMDSALQLLADTDDVGRRENALRESSALEEQRGNFEKALEHLRAAETLEARGREETDKARSDVLAARYQSERQLAEILSLREQAEVRDAELESQRLYRRLLLVALIGTALVLTLLGLGLAQHRRSARALSRSNEAFSAALADADRQRGHAQSLAQANAELLRVAAQDLQEPLLEIRAQSERLIASEALPADLRNQIAAISARSAAAVQTVRSLIDSEAMDRAAADAPQERVELNALARMVTEQMGARAAAKRQRIELDLPAQVLHCMGWRDQLGEALENLLDNALKFGPFGQCVQVRLSRDDRLQPPSAVIQVIDQGPGLRDADLQRLFGPFQRLSARPTGGESAAGLGLALVKRIVDSHGGQIDAGNGSHGGAEFRLTLPLA